MTRAVFLDRDGVVNRMVRQSGMVDSPQHPREFRLMPWAAAGIRLLNGTGLPVVIVSNQPGIAKGKMEPSWLEETTVLLRQRLDALGARLDGIYYCLHHPEGILPEYRVACDCRKPRPGLLERAAAELGLALEGSYMIGDQPTDVETGRAAGCHTVLIGGRHSQTRERLVSQPDQLCVSLMAAAQWVTARERSFAPVVA